MFLTSDRTHLPSTCPSQRSCAPLGFSVLLRGQIVACKQTHVDACFDNNVFLGSRHTCYWDAGTLVTRIQAHLFSSC